MVEWDEEKNESNAKKYGVRFEDTMGVFSDEFALVYEDNDHGEQRWKAIGIGRYLMVLVVIYTYRNTIRIISARRANKQERKRYEQEKR